MIAGSNEVRQLFFTQLDDDIGARLNHGSFGLTPAPVMKRRFELLKEQEAQPDVWFRANLMTFYTNAVEVAANVIGANAEDTFIIDNFTMGINSILKSLEFSTDEEILLTTHTYKGVQNTAKDVETIKGCKCSHLPLHFPIASEDEIVKLYENKFAENRKIKLAVIDHITSASALKLPIKQLVDLCRKYNVISVIDGAHAPGQIHLSMEDLGADFYSGTFYKWLYTARSCAFLWVSPNFRDQILHVVSSYHTHTTQHRFLYTGTRDYSSFYTLPAAVKFVEDMGGLEAILAYTDELLTWAQPMLCESLGVKPLEIPSSMRAPSMAVIGLPPWPKDEDPDPEELIVWFWNSYSVQVAFFRFDDKLWLRICANIYNTKNDYFKLRDALLDLFELKH